MTDEKINPATDGYWWCQNCKAEVGAYHVTYQERHEDCGHPAEWIAPVSALAQAKERGRQAGLREAAEICNRHEHAEDDFVCGGHNCLTIVTAEITRAAEGK